MINENVIKFIKICEYLSLKDKIKDLDKDFELRLVFQKIFYFLVKLGFPFKIRYSFYKYGPYSPGLADLYYKSMEISKEDLNHYTEIEFTDNEKQKIEVCKEILSRWGSDFEKFEYYASVLYVYDDMYFNNWNKISVRHKISIFKPKLFDKFGFEEVLEQLKHFNLIKNHN